MRPSTKTTFRNTKFVFLTLALLISGGSLCAQTTPSKEEIQKLNHAILYDLFMNYELAEKNGNLGVIVDFIPNFSETYKSVKISGNPGHEEQSCELIYAKGKVTRITYAVRGKQFVYNFNYTGNKLMNISIAERPKITITYDNKGRIHTLLREKATDFQVEYTFEYVDEERKANMKTVVFKGKEKGMMSPRNYYVLWDDAYRLAGYELDIYTIKAITYNGDASVNTFQFFNSDDTAVGTWSYSAFDDQKNWTKRTYKDTYMERSLVYTK